MLCFTMSIQHQIHSDCRKLSTCYKKIFEFGTLPFLYLRITTEGAVYLQAQSTN